MRTLSQWLTVIVIAGLLLSCSSGEETVPEVNSQSTSASEEPITVFQDTSEISVERIRDEDTIVVGVIIDEENLMSPQDRQPGVAFVGAIDKLNADGGLLGKQVTVLSLIHISEPTRPY